MTAELDTMAQRAEILLKRSQARESLAMARKARTETIWYPVTVAATILGAGVGLTLLALRLLGQI